MTTLLDDWRAIVAVVAMPNVSSEAKMVFLRLLDHRNRTTAQCNPSYARLSTGTGMTKRRVMSAVAQLEAAGLIEVNRTSGGDPTMKKGYVTNAYRLIFNAAETTLGPSAISDTPPDAEYDTPPSAKSSTPPSEVYDTPRVLNQAPPRVRFEALPPGAVTALPPSASKRTLNNQHETANDKRPNITIERSPPARGSSDIVAFGFDREPDAFDADPFEEFWRVYPRKAAKGAAKKAFDAALKKISAAALITAAVRYGGATAETEQRFIKHPATWLNAESWEDEPTRARGALTLDQFGDPVEQSAASRNAGGNNRRLTQNEQVDIALDEVRARWERRRNFTL